MVGKQLSAANTNPNSNMECILTKYLYLISNILNHNILYNGFKDVA